MGLLKTWGVIIINLSRDMTALSRGKHSARLKDKLLPLKIRVGSLH